MAAAPRLQTVSRYTEVTEDKASGATYTPPQLADFVASQMIAVWKHAKATASLRVLDPAIGDGELILALLKQIPSDISVEVFGFDSDAEAIAIAHERILKARKNITLHLVHEDFLIRFASEATESHFGGLFQAPPLETYDLVIANPPYVRTQIMGASVAQALADQFSLTGRVDLYHAFLLAIARVLRPNGVAGVITSNRFMSTKAGATVRQGMREQLDLQHIWDFGDTKLFDAAVLPAVLIAKGLNGQKRTTPKFSSIYETKESASFSAASVTTALNHEGIVGIPDGRHFFVQHGLLDDSDEGGIWRVATAQNDAWLKTVQNHTWGTFGQIGKVRVGVKTCADKVFIRKDWSTLPKDQHPELLRPLTTHHHAQRFRGPTAKSQYQIVYPHEVVDGKRRAIDIENFPLTKAYLENNRATLEARTYVIEGGRNWYELWVPQDPASWPKPKLVFRDISEEPCFWIDLKGSVVNGDCYWLTSDTEGSDDLLWLAVGVANSKFIETFYDHRFNNKLYAGRRRFITQYVEQFPLPDPKTPVAQAIVNKAKAIYEGTDTVSLEAELNALIWSAFGLVVEEAGR